MEVIQILPDHKNARIPYLSILTVFHWFQWKQPVTIMMCTSYLNRTWLVRKDLL